MNKRDKCYKIYCEAFGNDEPQFTNLLFDKCFGSCIYSEVSNEIASMFFALNCKIETETENIPAIYIYAAATSEKFRSKGYMTRLLEDYKTNMNDKSVVFLRPANEGLIKFYSNCGFKEIKAINDNSALPLVKPKGSFAELTKDISNGNGEEFTLMYYSKTIINLNNLHFIYSME